MRQPGDAKSRRGTEANFELGYKQDDFALTEAIWDEQRSKFMAIISKNDPINGVIDIPV